jgi:hypothetical protein
MDVWLTLGIAGAVVALGILAAQVVIWRRTEDPACAFTRAVALHWVGAPLAVIHAALFLTLGGSGRPVAWWLGGLFTVAMTPVRRLLNLKAFAVIVRTVEYEGGPVVDRGGAAVATMPYWQLAVRWHRFEYSGPGVGNVVVNKVLAALLALFCWPLVALGAQVSHALMCQEPHHALGHETDDGDQPGEALRSVGAARLI